MTDSELHHISDLEQLSTVPERIRQLIDERAALGELKPNGQLPSERRLTDHLGVARMNVRKALWQLEAEGFIYRFHRSGWYLSPPRFFYDPSRDFSFTKVVVDQGHEAGAKVLSTGSMVANAAIAGLLGIEAGTKLTVIRRLRFIDDRPVFVEISHVIEGRCPKLVELASTDISLATVYEREYGILLRRRELYFHPTALSDPHARDLRLAHGTPGLFVRRITDG
ncbi:GntR family transcriptional regulator [Microvirga sp. VF16]|uniref:GntR family transcriptional regulator n=1 Tax=Microvirga sp. VF16 TaxID=2807101 RepID=UPI00193E0C9C|nr:GntR family transcriptional regulator [Microvirga sp. VF16]QRM32567.1 GntR family transcriptional regulator [Microvirga sp. VF16]